MKMQTKLKTRNFLAVSIVLFLTTGAFAVEYEPQVLNEVTEKIARVQSDGKNPIVIFDLDDTVINTRQRNVRILRDFVRRPEIKQNYPDAVQPIQALSLESVRYQLTDTLKGIGISDPEFLMAANEFWQRRFFSNQYCQNDQEIELASEYVQSVFDQGATVIYLTGRDSFRMFQGTLKNLKKLGFPIDEDRARLVMKPDKAMDDLAFKKGFFSSLSKIGEVVAAFENEPANINALQSQFSTGIMVFLDTIHSPKPDVPASGIKWISNFKHERYSDKR